MQRGFVGVAINPSGVVLRDAPLAALQCLLDLEDAVLQPELDVGLTGSVHPVVERPEEAVGVVLRIPLEPPVLLRDELLGIHAQVAVRIAHEPHVGRLGDEDTTVEDLQRPREHEPVGKHGALVHPAVAVHVLEDHDAADRLVLVRTGDVRP